MAFSTMTEAEADDLAAAKQAYQIFRGSQRGEKEKLFPHDWDGLPQHYKELLMFVVAHARGGL